MRTLWFALAPMVLATATTASARAPEGLDAALERLARDGQFSGAVVVRNAKGVRFSRGYGFADPFARVRFTGDTPVDSASLAKPVTAAAVLHLALDGRLDLDSPVRSYLDEFPHGETTVRHLLAHSAGLTEDAVSSHLGMTNAALLTAYANPAPRFPPGTRFDYCNLCYSTLALLVERVAGVDFLDFARDNLGLPRRITIRPEHLGDWQARAIGWRRNPAGAIERSDSYEGELFYGSGNLSVSAAQLASWGAEWWRPRLAALRPMGTASAMIAGKASGLSWGNWYCARDGGPRCHYLGHHEGFHHMLYWDGDRRLAVGMVSNNTLAPSLQQRLQRALVAFAEGRSADARDELSRPLVDGLVPEGRFTLSSGEAVELVVRDGRTTIARGGLVYPAYPFAKGIRYVPGLDVYLAGSPNGRLRWLSLYEDLEGTIDRRP